MPSSLDWITRIEEALAEMDEVPLLGYSMPFPSDRVASHLQKAFEWPSVQIKSQTMQWRSAEESLEGFGHHPLTTNFLLAPLNGQLQIALPEKELDKFSVLLLKNAAARELPQEFKLGALHFFYIELLHALSESGFLQGMSPQLIGDGKPMHEPCFTCDVSFYIGKEAFLARLLLSKALQSSYRKHFSEGVSFTPSPEQLRRLDLLLPIVLGKTRLPMKTWKSLRVGDLLVLKGCSYDPKSQKGSMLLMLGDKVLFRGRLRHNEFKLLDAPFYYEELEPMEKDEDEAFEDFEENAEEEDQDEEETAYENEEDQTQERLKKLGDLSVTVTVEMARLRMTAEQLLALRPGNLLELDHPADANVQLIVNGRRMGKGELVRIGDVIGVRITHL